MRSMLSAVAAVALVAQPAVLTAQRPGELIAADPVTETPAGMQAWRIRYWTTDGSSRPVQASGMVVAPREALPREPRKVLAWTHGTWGVTEKCAPSQSSNFWNASPGLDAVKRGYVVVAPDYVGLGSAGDHPFLVGADTARAVLDSVRAAGAIPGAAAGKRFAVFGESQGGHAALWTAQRAHQYAPDLDIVGASAAAPPTTLLDNMMQAGNKTVRAFFLSYIGYSWNRHYGAPLDTFGNRQTQGIMSRLADKCIELHSKPKLRTVLGILTVQNRWKNLNLGLHQPWASLARRNSPTTANIGVPLIISQDPKDDLVAPAVTRAYARRLCQNGNRVHWIDIKGDGHITSGKLTAAATIDWADRLFAGGKAPSDCGRF
ncbi:lipase family protein [Sphingomonas jaspsi]|uniref:lipase family protein n=1 Tax=Sphingomonas jaspsi TaxID=392409 RepID=UPI0004B5BFC2|nr:lipase family protein [Sphingomonas jaspsi]